MPAERRPYLHPAARAEVNEAVDQYEQQREGRGAAFDVAVDRAIAKIIEAPERWPAARRVPPRLGAHGYMLKRYRYDIVYRLVGDDELEVVAVAHHKRRPGYWAKR